jgi:hypothetical protein
MASQAVRCVQSLVEQRLNFGYGCYGCREATDIPPNETVLGLPVCLLPPIFEYLEFLNEKAIPASGSKRALAALQQSRGPISNPQSAIRKPLPPCDDLSNS